MKIEIDCNPYDHNYSWKVWTGPDGIDFAEGTELTLGSCFEKIVEFRLMNGLTYGEDLKNTITAYFNSINQK